MTTSKYQFEISSQGANHLMMFQNLNATRQSLFKLFRMNRPTNHLYQKHLVQLHRGLHSQNISKNRHKNGHEILNLRSRRLNMNQVKFRVLRESQNELEKLHLDLLKKISTYCKSMPRYSSRSPTNVCLSIISVQNEKCWSDGFSLRMTIVNCK